MTCALDQAIDATREAFILNQARNICDAQDEGYRGMGHLSYLTGMMDKSHTMRVAIAALERGIELGKTDAVDSRSEIADRRSTPQWWPLLLKDAVIALREWRAPK